MSDLLDKLKAGTANRKTIKWPGTDADVAVCVISDQDHHEAALAADNIYKAAKIDISMQNVSDYDAERVDQILFRALADPSTGERVAPSITEFRRLLMKGTRDALIADVNAFQDECSPSPFNMSDEAFDEVLQSVKKNAGKTLSSVSNIVLARRLIASLVADLPVSQPASGSIS